MHLHLMESLADHSLFSYHNLCLLCACMGFNVWYFSRNKLAISSVTTYRCEFKNFASLVSTELGLLA